MVLTSVKGGLVVTSQIPGAQAEMVFYNTTQFANKRHETHPVFDDVPSSIMQEGDLKRTYGHDSRAVAEVRYSTQSSLVLARSLRADNAMIIYQITSPFLLKDSKSFSDEAVGALSRVPMMVCAIGGVAVYQLFLKKDAPFSFCKDRRGRLDGDDGPMSESKRLIESFSKDARRKGKMTP